MMAGDRFYREPPSLPARNAPMLCGLLCVFWIVVGVIFATGGSGSQDTSGIGLLLGAIAYLSGYVFVHWVRA